MAQLREGSVIKKSTGDEVIATVNDIPEIPTSLPAEGGNADTIGGFTVGTNVPANAKFTDTNTTYSEISTSEIDAGTSSTLRAITGRRIKHILDKVAIMISSLTKSDVGLDRVDNTSDTSKPVSTAQQSALDLKADKSQVLTNVPANAKFTDTDTITTINGKTGAITKSDIVALGIPSSNTNTTYSAGTGLTLAGTVFTPTFGKIAGTVVQGNDSRLSDARVPLAHNQAINTITGLQGALDGKVNNSQVLTNVPEDAIFTDTIYTHPTGTNPHGTTKADIGLGSVDNKSSATIRGEITKANITGSLGYTPIKNGGSTPEFKSGLENARGSATNSGLVYFATDTQKIYKDTGVWTQMGGQDLSIASTTKLGGIKVGANLSITADGTLSAVDDDSKSTFIVKQELFTATEGQTLFNLTKGNYQPNTNTISVYLYGGKQPNVSINEISTSSFEIIEPLKAGNVVLVEYIELSSATPYPIHGSDHLLDGYDPIPLVTTSKEGLMSKGDKSKLDDIENGANKYVHPNTHPASIITESSSRRFVSDSEKSTWNSVANKTDKAYVDGELQRYVPLSGNSVISGTKTFSDVLKNDGIENFNNVYVKKALGRANIGTRYADLDSEIRTGGYHRFWKISFPSGTNFWGKVKISLYGTYSSFNSSGKMAKEINVNFNGATMYSNVGCYTELSGFVEKDFRISEAIWNSETSQWEFWIYSHQLQGNNTPYIYIEGWANGTNYINTFNGITFNKTPVFLQDTTYENARGNSAGQNLIKPWTDLPTYQNPYGDTIASLDDLPTNLSNLTKDINFDERYYTETEVNNLLNSKVDNSRVLTDVPANAKFTDTITTINGKTGAISKADIVALGIPAQDTVYTHPATHPASMITESTSRRFVSDTEKATWNNKASKSVATTSADGLMSSADKLKLNGIQAGAQVNTVTSVAGKTGAVTLSKSDVGLSNVENKSSATIRSEITKANVTNALNYTPVKDGGNTPELRSGIESARPNATGSGTVYFATDTQKIYKDTASGRWTQMGGQDLPIATKTTLGGIKVGNNLSVADDGTIHANDNPASFIVKQEVFVATEGQMVFNLTQGNYKPNTNTLSIYLYGGKQPNMSITETSSTSFKINNPLKVGTVLIAEYFEIINIHPYPHHSSEHLTGGHDPIPKVTALQDGLMTKEDKSKLNDIEDNANKYIHPAKHDASMIVESDAKRFVSNVEKEAWNDKQDRLGYIPVNKTGDTMTGPLKISGNILSTEFAADNWSFINHYMSGGWARGIVNVKDDSNSTQMQIGVHGSGQTLNRMYFGKAWNDFAVEIFPATKRTNFVGALTKEGKAVATEEYIDNKVKTDVPVNAKFTDTIYTHPGSGTNPHGTTKSNVGLGSVLNYGLATQAQAEAGTSNARYMTPLRVKQAIDSSPTYHVGKTDTPNKNLLWINTNL